MCIMFSLHWNIYLLNEQNCSSEGKIWYFMNNQISIIYGLRIMKSVSSPIHLWQKNLKITSYLTKYLLTQPFMQSQKSFLNELFVRLN